MSTLGAWFQKTFGGMAATLSRREAFDLARAALRAHDPAFPGTLQLKKREKVGTHIFWRFQATGGSAGWTMIVADGTREVVIHPWAR